MDKNIFTRNVQMIVNQLVGDQKNLAPIFNVSKQTISNWINKSPSIPFLLWIEEKTGISPLELFNENLTPDQIIIVGSNKNLPDKKESDSPSYKAAADDLRESIKEMTAQLKYMREENERLRASEEQTGEMLDEMIEMVKGAFPKGELEKVLPGFTKWREKKMRRGRQFT